MRARLASRLFTALACVALAGVLCGGSCQVSTSWCSHDDCVDGCDCDGGSCCALGTCCGTVTESEPPPASAVIVTTDALGQESVWLDARGRIVRVDAVQFARER